jgi:hypothetical protein
VTNNRIQYLRVRAEDADMSPVTPVRLLLAAQAAVTALFAVAGALSGWTYASLLVAAAAVFVATAVHPEPAWRWYALAFEVGSVLFGLAALAAAHSTPGTLVAVAGALWLGGRPGARAFLGAPSAPLALGTTAAPSAVLDVLPSR